MNKKDNPRLSIETLIEVIAVNKKTLKASKKVTTIEKATELKKSSGYFYYYFQLGYSSFYL